MTLSMVSICLTFGVPALATQSDLSWATCSNRINIPARPFIAKRISDEDFYITANSADIDTEDLSILQGDVEMSHGNQQISTDILRFSQPDNISSLEGNIQYWNQFIYLEADRGEVQMDTGASRFEDIKYSIEDIHAHGSSDYIDVELGAEINLKNAHYSRCDPDNKFWNISASRLSIDRDRSVGNAHHVIVEIKDIPVFYLPYISFPLGKQRKTGFLTPKIGNSSRNGIEVTTPFYWNIEPHMDATLIPRLFSDSGLMLDSELHHITKDSRSDLSLQYLPKDKKYNDDGRGLISLRQQHKFYRRGNFLLNYNRVSDRQYLEDFGANLDTTGTRLLEQSANISYNGDWWDATATLQNYQVAEQTITNRHYKRLPTITFNAYSPVKSNEPLYSFSSEFSYFRNGGNRTNTIATPNGSRLDLISKLGYLYATDATFLKPELVLHYTRYKLEDHRLFESDPSRFLPLFSVDSGIFFERDIDIFSKPLLQTLEARLFYLYVPEKAQDNLPVFDTGLYDLSFDGLFRKNRFNGNDRIGDANQFTLALSSRLISDKTGKEKGYFSIGQTYYLDKSNITLPSAGAGGGRISPLLMQSNLALSDAWVLSGNLQWDTDNSRIEGSLARIQYKPTSNKVINLSHHVRKTASYLAIPNTDLLDIEQSDISFSWPVKKKLNLISKWNYSISEKRTLEIFGGVEYSSCCWGIRVVVQRFLPDLSGELDTGILLQLELKGLSDVGHETTDFLKRRIPGYHK